jgi:hypothetical protein
MQAHKKAKRKIKFQASICDETLAKLARFECGKPNLSQDSSAAESDHEQTLESKLIPVIEKLPSLKTMCRKDYIISSAASPEFLKRFQVT